MPNLDRKYFSSREIADLIGEPEARITRWIGEGSIRVTNVHHEWQVERRDLIAFARPLIPRERLDPIEYPSGLGDAVGPDASNLGGVLASGVTPIEFERAARVQPLFHYTSATTALDAILTSASLRLNSPVGMNDPFESERPNSSIVVERGPTDITGEEWDELRPRLDKMLDEIDRLMRDTCRLACLTRSGPWWDFAKVGDGYTRARMWSQYGAGHTGVCLSFDQDALRGAFRDEFASRAGVRLYEAPLRYRGSMEALEPVKVMFARATAEGANLGDYIDDLFPSRVADLYFSKAWDWSTETEQRFLVQGDVREFEYVNISSALTAIFLGPRFPGQRLRDLKARCPRLWEMGRVFQLSWQGPDPGLTTVGDDALDDGPSWSVPPQL